MIQTSPITTPNSANRPQGGRPSADESGHERAEANVFSTLLGLARVLGDEKLRTGRTTASPTQMFEAATNGDAHANRLDALRNDANATTASSIDLEKNDPTSTHARREARINGKGQELTPRSPHATLQNSRREISEPSPPKSAEPLRPTGSTMSPADRAAQSTTFPGHHASPTGRAETAMHSANPAPSGGAGIREMNGHLPGSVSSSASARVDAAKAVDARSQSAPARQVAQILGAARGGSVETDRAAGSLPTSHDAREASEDNKKHKGTSLNTRSQSNPAVRAADSADMMRRPEFDQLIRSIRLRSDMNLSSARMQLEPPELGRIFVEVRMEGETLRIGVRTETAKARDLLFQRAGQLRAALQQHGIHVEQFDVMVNGADDEAEGSSGTVDSNNSDRPDRDDRGSDLSASASESLWEDPSLAPLAERDEAIYVVAKAKLDIKA